MCSEMNFRTKKLSPENAGDERHDVLRHVMMSDGMSLNMSVNINEVCTLPVRRHVPHLSLNMSIKKNEV